MRACIPHVERDDYLRIKPFDALLRKISSGIEGEPVIARRQARVRRKQIAQASVIIRCTFADVFPNSRRSLLLQHYGDAARGTARRNIQNVCSDGAHAFAVCEMRNRLPYSKSFRNLISVIFLCSSAAMRSSRSAAL